MHTCVWCVQFLHGVCVCVAVSVCLWLPVVPVLSCDLWQFCLPSVFRMSFLHSSSPPSLLPPFYPSTLILVTQQLPHLPPPPPFPPHLPSLPSLSPPHHPSLNPPPSPPLPLPPLPPPSPSHPPSLSLPLVMLEVLLYCVCHDHDQL